MKKTIFLLLAILMGLLLASCQEQAATLQPAGEVPPTVVSESGITVEGKLVPEEFLNLSFSMGGTVNGLAVEEGQEVEAGQVLARLDQGERLASAVASAELELVAAQQALKDLQDNTDVRTAAANQAVADAKDQVRDAQRYLDNLQKGSRTTDIDSARADTVILKDQLDQAQEDFSAYERKPEDNLQRAEYLSKLADARQRYDDAVRLLNNLQGSASEIDLAIAEANLLLAQARQALAEKQYAEVQNGPDPDDLEATQARVKAAESALLAAHAALADTELVAPVGGTVVKVDLKEGEQIQPGMPAIVLADFSKWYVETQDLNEMEIPNVSVGQAVTVTPDALPDLELSGTVESISQIYEEKFGDVTYTARILLQDDDPRLRWGMTASVNFEQ